jgi:hypothetical protein
MIFTLILFTNGMIGAFDINGEQIACFQGKARDVLDERSGLRAVLKNSLHKQASIYFANWNSREKLMIQREQFDLFCDGWLS